MDFGYYFKLWRTFPSTYASNSDNTRSTAGSATAGPPSRTRLPEAYTKPAADA
jgi:hypothetical protein